MTAIGELLRLVAQGRSINESARAAGVSRSSAQQYVKLARAAGVNYELLKSLSDSEIHKRLGTDRRERSTVQVLPDFKVLSVELGRKGVTLRLLWEEYIKATPEGYSYSNFCLHYRKWRQEQKLSYRQVYKGGEKAFTDYSGQKVPIYHSDGSVSEAEIFVMVLGASNYTYVEASNSQNLYCWIGAHVRALKYFGGVPLAEVIDNLKSGVSKACRYEPEVNRAFAQFAEHYGLAILPCRTFSPRDKAKVEEAVKNVESRILAVLRNTRFSSIEQLNQAIKPLLEELNARQMQTYDCSRKELFEELDRPNLKPLPSQPYEFGSWKIAKLNIDYHIEINRHYYSAPCQYVGKKVEVFIGEKNIRIYHERQCLATHLRDDTPYRHSTVKEHMPPSHQAMQDWSPSRFLTWAEKLGPAIKQQVASLLQSRQHPEQAYRSCLGLLRLEKKYGTKRLSAACEIVNSFGIASFGQVAAVLKNNRDQIAPQSHPTPQVIATHSNIRGQDYFH